MLQKIIARLAARRMYKRTVLELNELTDKELQDIGIHRGMINCIAKESYDEYLREFHHKTAVNQNLKGWV